MTQVLQVGKRTITSAEIIPLLTSYQMLSQFLREFIIDQAIAPIEFTPQEQASAFEQFEEKHLPLTTQTECSTTKKRYGMTDEQLEALATRELRISKFKENTWGHQLKSYFLNYKSKFDKVIFSLIRTQELEVAQELYFRIQAGEQTFAEVARAYSQGSEAKMGGLIGAVELSMPHPVLAKMLSISQPGQLWPPTRLGEWVVILRLEKLIPAQLDEPMRQQILNELFEAWLQEQMNQLDAVHPQDVPVALAA